MRKTLFFITLIILTGYLASAQVLFAPKQNIEVKASGQALTLAWAGGLNAGQYSNVDLDNDGDEDLVIFDRSSNSLRPFLSTGDGYVYAPEYESLFPEDLESWLLLVDYNCDGLPDLFTHTNFGVRVFKNVSIPNQPIQFQLANALLLTEGFTSNINLNVSLSDMPAISDIDGDGDIDILKPLVTGGGVELHLNRSMELYGVCDSLVYKRVTQSWGNFEECACEDFAFGETCQDKNGRLKHAGGKSLLVFDQDGDGDVDLLYGDEDCKSLVLFNNKLESVNAVFDEYDAAFPSASNPASAKTFPAGYFVDVDFDGIRDLVVAPNQSTSRHLDFIESSGFYKNMNSNASPVFEFKQYDLLQSEMIEVGSNSAPSFIDLDADGDLDMLVGNEGLIQDQVRSASLWYFENKGSPDLPSFELMDNDFISLASRNFTRIRPSNVDFDADGRTDLIFTAFEGGKKGIYYILNNSNVGPSVYQGSDLKKLPFNLSADAHVTFSDLDEDGRVDMLLGNFNGRLDFYKNTGSGTPVFVLEQEAFMGISLDPSKTSIRPLISSLTKDGEIDLITTDRNNILTVYQDLGTPVQNLLFNSILQTNTSLSLGGHTGLAFADLYNTGRPVLVVGNALGGLTLYDNLSESINEDTSLELSVFPNPASTGAQEITILPNQSTNIEVISMLGQVIFRPTFVFKNQGLKISTSRWSKGVYIVRAQSSSGQAAFSRLLVQH